MLRPQAGGKHIVGKFEEALSGFLVLENNRRVKLTDVRAVVIERGTQRKEQEDGLDATGISHARQA